MPSRHPLPAAFLSTPEGPGLGSRSGMLFKAEHTEHKGVSRAQGCEQSHPRQQVTTDNFYENTFVYASRMRILLCMRFA